MKQVIELLLKQGNPLLRLFLHCAAQVSFELVYTLVLRYFPKRHYPALYCSSIITFPLDTLRVRYGSLVQYPMDSNTTLRDLFAGCDLLVLYRTLFAFFAQHAANFTPAPNKHFGRLVCSIFLRMLLYPISHAKHQVQIAKEHDTMCYLDTLNRHDKSLMRKFWRYHQFSVMYEIVVYAMNKLLRCWQ